MDATVKKNSKISCTIAVLTFNSGKTLERALESAKDFAEILVCDGGSTDGTLLIAERYGARVLPQDARFKDREGRIMDFSGVRNQTLSAAKYDWFFYLDSDELLTPELVTELDGLIRTNGSIRSNGVVVNEAAVWVDRKYILEDVQKPSRCKAAARSEPNNSSSYYEGEPEPLTQQMKVLGRPQGKVIECAATYPTRQMRFFHKDAVTEFIKPIHERINPKSDAVIKTTENFMLVPMSSDPRVMREKWKHYIELEVARRGKISFWEWVEMCMENAKISFLYAFRLIRNTIFCSGPKMPFALEWERHVYHWNLCRQLLSITEKLK